MDVEMSQLWLTCEKPLGNNTFTDGRAIRGYFSNTFGKHPEFHNHQGSSLIYKHPSIQYKIIGGSALIVGLKEGAYLLKAVPKLPYLEIYKERYVIYKQDLANQRVHFGLSETPILYRFLTPWLALNEINYQRYNELSDKEVLKCKILNKVLIGNILSMSKALGYCVDREIQINGSFKESGRIKAKNEFEALAFTGEFFLNFSIPDFWGIGKFSSRGYGTLKRRNGEDNNE
jgi:hypothetical protein